MKLARSITEEPLAPAKAVANPAIKDILDLDSGEFLSASDFISGHLYQDLMVERRRILERMNAGNPRYVCEICQVPVYLVSKAEEHIFFFRHRSEDGSCPAQTRSPLTYEEICARKYHGLRESEPHKRIKALILRSLDADPAFSGILSEKNWKSAKDSKNFRRPDVQANSTAGRLAFEVQLSTTFLNVVVGRREFYRSEGALLVWVFAGFDHKYRLLTTDDLLFSNNSNVFVVDDETTAKSEASGVFHLRCHHRRPVLEGGKVTDGWEERVVSFHDLIQDREEQRAFLFDYAAAEKELRDKIEKEAAEREAHLAWIDQQDFYEFWMAHGRHFAHTPENRAVWDQLKGRFAERGITLPEYPDFDPEMGAMLNALYSAREGAPVIWKFKKLVEVAHLLAESHPRQLIAFGHALKLYERSKLVAEQDTKGKWKTRSAAISKRMRIYDPEFIPDEALLPLMRFLFPEVEKNVSAYLDKFKEHGT